MPASKVRPDLPKSPGEIIKLAQKIAAKHTALADKSPLGQIKWADVTLAINTADEAHKDSKTLAAQAVTATQTRDKALIVLNGFIRDARDVLGVVHKEELRHLSDYGFTVTAGGANGGKKTASPPSPTT